MRVAACYRRVAACCSLLQACYSALQRDTGVLQACYRLLQAKNVRHFVGHFSEKKCRTFFGGRAYPCEMSDILSKKNVRHFVTFFGGRAYPCVVHHASVQ